MKIDTLSGSSPKLEMLPQSSLRISRQDIELLTSWADETTGTTLYERDALAWRYGQPLDRAVWTISAEPTLRVVEVEWANEMLPGVSQAFGTEWRDQVNAANATWVDLAVQVVKARDTLILYTGSDPHGARRTALRSALQRHGRHAVPRQRIRHATPDVLDQLKNSCPNVVLLYEPEQWDPQIVQALKAHTVIVVVPYFKSPHGMTKPSMNGSWETSENDEAPTLPSQDQSWLPRKPLDWKTQEDYLRELGQGRTVERTSQHGIPNTSETAARIDWPALRHLPDRGQILVANDVLLLRAAVWYQLTTERKPQVTDRETLSPSWFSDLHSQASAAENAIKALHSSSLPLEAG